MISEKYSFEELGLVLREISNLDLLQPFRVVGIDWTIEDFWNNTLTEGMQSFVITLDEDVVVAFTVQLPSDCRCDNTKPSCLKLYMIAHNDDANVKERPARTLIRAIEYLARTFGKSCMELDAIDSLHTNDYYKKLEYEDCGKEYEDEERIFYPMRKWLTVR